MTAVHGVPLSKVLRALSPQLLSLGTQMAKLEEVIGLAVSSTDVLAHDLILEMQELDRIRQSILDIARLTRHLSEETVDGIISAEHITAISKTLHLSLRAQRIGQ